MTTKSKIRPINAFGDTLLEEMAKSFPAKSTTTTVTTVVSDDIQPKEELKGEAAEEKKEEMEPVLDNHGDNDSDATIPVAQETATIPEQLPNELPGKFEELIAASAKPAEQKIADLTEQLAQIQAQLESLTPKKKDISVAESMYDDPIQYEFYDIFDAFMSACYKLSIASEVTEDPMTAQYMALVDEFGTMLKQAITEDNASDTEDGDGTADDFNGDKSYDEVKVKAALQNKITNALKAGSRHNRGDTQTINQIYELIQELADTGTAAEVVEEVVEEKTDTPVEVKAEVETKTLELEELDEKIRQKTEEYERITKQKLPRPDEAKPDVVASPLLTTQKARKSFIGMDNADFLSMDLIG